MCFRYFYFYKLDVVRSVHFFVSLLQTSIENVGDVK